MTPLQPFAPQTPYVVGRDDELGALDTALNSATGQTTILYFVGSGGIGKTRLVEEGARRAPASVRVTPVIDLYHTETHSVAGLERLLVEGLDPQAEYFVAYRQQSAELEKRRLGGVRITPEEQAALTQTFVRDYAVLTAQQRLCLRFDTTELIQRESDRVQQLCQLETSYLEIRDWFLQVLPQLPNTVIVLAGRSPAPLREELQALAEQRDALSFEAFDLGGLSTAACHAYLAALQEQEPRLGDIPTEVWELAWKYTAGHPVRLSLVIDLVLNGRNIAELFPANIKSESELPLDPDNNIDAYLMAQLLDTVEPNRTLFIYLAQARKGLDAVLLHDLEPEWDLEKCQAFLDAMRRFTFVKEHPGTGQLFLHDEVYALFDRYVLQERQEHVGAYRRIRDYHEKRLEAHPDQAALLKPDLLYYALQVDPWEGFWRTYLPWAEEAVRAGDDPLDMRLRDTLLHFRRDIAADPWGERRLPTDLLERDAAVRWCRRYLTQGQHERVLEIARRIQESKMLAKAPLQTAALAITRAEAALYTAQEGQIDVLGELQVAISALKNWSPEGEDDPRAWWRGRLLGRAHNNLGYHHWMRGQYKKAVEEFRQAIWRYREADIKDEMAATLTNLGFIYIQQGLAIEAETVLQDAIGLRKQGPSLPLAYSLNTLGLAYINDARPVLGARRCEQALRIFEELGQLRGAGLAHLALGLAYRRRAEKWKEEEYTPEEAVEFYQASYKHLEKARDIFSTAVKEPLRLWEAYNELGSLCCDWAWLLSKHSGNGVAQDKYREAIKWLDASVKVVIAKKELELQLAESYDDLSQVHADRGNEAESEVYVAKVLALIPAAYRLTLEGFQHSPEPAVEEWWRLLGKVHLGTAVRQIKWAVDLEKALRPSDEVKDQWLAQAAEDYAYAVAYFQQYSPYSVHLGQTLKSIQQRIKTLTPQRIKRMYQLVSEFAKKRNVNLDRLLHLLENTMGLE